MQMMPIRLFRVLGTSNKTQVWLRPEIVVQKKQIDFSNR